jgi:hypothetical protein
MVKDLHSMDEVIISILTGFIVNKKNNNTKKLNQLGKEG